MTDRSKKGGKEKRGPEPERLIIRGEWRDAMDKALKKKRPENGWPNGKQQKDEKEENTK